MALHRELELFVESGFTEFEAIRASTIVSADAMNLRNLGRITERAIADLIILNENPIKKISNTKDLKYIIKAGKLYKPEELIDAVPTDDENQIILDKLIKKFKDNDFSVDQFQ